MWVRPSGLTKRHLLSILGIVSTASPIPTHPLVRFIVNENHNGINLICIFKGNYKRLKYDLTRKSKGYCWLLVVLLDTFLTCKISKKNINVGKSVCVSTISSINMSKTSGRITIEFYLKHHLCGGKGCIRFSARSDQNSGFHGNR